MTNDSAIRWPHEAFYIESLLSLTNAIAVESACLENAIQGLGPDHHVHPDNHFHFIYPAQNIVSNVAAISRFLWPSKSKKSSYPAHKGRGELLQSVLRLDHDSYLKNRSVRNHIEHFDEILDNFLSKNPTGTFFPTYVGSGNVIQRSHEHVFRAYYTDMGVFSILGQDIVLKPLLEEVRLIDLILEQCKANGERFIRPDQSL